MAARRPLPPPSAAVLAVDAASKLQAPPTPNPTEMQEMGNRKFAEESGKAKKRMPIACLVVGMAGVGKTTLMQRLNHYTIDKQREAHQRDTANVVERSSGGDDVANTTTTTSSSSNNPRTTPCYYVNMDPAVRHVPFSASIDIRDTVDYKQVMKHYKLGPNGAIMTSLNLFATRFDQVLDILERRAADPSMGLSHIFFDTPGQIEVFTWSASGMIITETLAVKFPTVLLYIVDTPRTTNPTTFMSNMLYACSMFYKTGLPIVIVFNKTDVTPADFAQEWMDDFEKFQEALDAQREQNYMTSLNRSMGLVLDEFYRTLRAVAVSSATGAGIPELFDAIGAAAAEYERDYLPEIMRRKGETNAKKSDTEEKRQQAELTRIMKDMQIVQNKSETQNKETDGMSNGSAESGSGDRGNESGDGR